MMKTWNVWFATKDENGNINDDHEVQVFGKTIAEALENAGKEIESRFADEYFIWDIGLINEDVEF